jgi:hypothetical protein
MWELYGKQFMAETTRRSVQSRLHRFDSGWRLLRRIGFRVLPGRNADDGGTLDDARNATERNR